MRWIQKCDIDEDLLPIPTQIVSNEEFAPPDQTPEQKRVENRLIEIAGTSSRRLGISRRKFLARTGGMAAAFLAMNEVFGNFFEVRKTSFTKPPPAMKSSGNAPLFLTSTRITSARKR